MIMAGCDDIEPTPTPTETAVIMPASATVMPIPPTEDEPAENAEISDAGYTPAAVPTFVGVSVTITPTPQPTVPSLDMQFTAPDGLLIAGAYYPAAQRPAPAVILLHMYGSTKEAWMPIIPALQAAGYNVITIDLRGHGATGGTADWVKAQQDVLSVYQQVSVLPNVIPTRISLIGGNVGANLAITACAALESCRSIVLISPSLDYLGVTTTDAMTALTVPALLVASRADASSSEASARLNGLGSGERRLILNEGDAHGTNMLTSQPDLNNAIIQWLNTH
jgi:pimeloyl-ACP methyl ester carboxylesterase